MKTKPAGHVKKGDTIIFFNHAGVQKSKEQIYKVQDYDLDPRMIQLFIPAKHIKLQGGGRVEVSKKSTVIIDKNEQVTYED